MNYLGFDVLESAPNAREAQTDTLRRSLAILDPGVGKRAIRARDQASPTPRTYLWTAQGKAQIVALQTWLAARKGQAVPFWLPSFRQDLTLSQDISPSDTIIHIQDIGYAKHMFPGTNARRHLVFFHSSGWLLRKVTAASASAGEEALTLSAQLSLSFAKAGRLGFLLFCRLATDEPELVYRTDSVAECSLPYVEIPEEAP